MKLFNKTYLSFRIIVSFCFIVLFTQGEIRKLISVSQYTETEEVETGKEESNEEESNEEYRLTFSRVYHGYSFLELYKKSKLIELYFNNLNKAYVNYICKLYLKYCKLTFYE